MLVALIIVTIVALFLGVKTFKLRNQTNQLLELITALNIKIDSTSDPVKEDFLKFVSDSREWAFEYIEEVQKVITDFKTDVESHIHHFDRFGEVLSNQRPDYEAMKAISIAYKQLISVLPMENDVTNKE